MKILLLSAILSVLAISCSNHQQNENKTEATAGKVTHEHKETKEKLELNSGAKWKADSSTNSNVKNLQTIVEKFNGGADKSIGTYTSVAEELQAGLDKMIADCRMKGPDHDALHKWLEPLIGNVTRLKGSTSEQEAADLMKEVDQHLRLFAQYFE